MLSKNIFTEVIKCAAKECGTTVEEMFKNNKEYNVDARGISIVILTELKLTESIISRLTGMTQQAVNRLKNIYPERIKHSFYLQGVIESVRQDILLKKQQ